MAVTFLNALLKLSLSVWMECKILCLALFGMRQLETECRSLNPIDKVH